jgi:hypothetical protein
VKFRETYEISWVSEIFMQTKFFSLPFTRLERVGNEAAYGGATVGLANNVSNGGKWILLGDPDTPYDPCLLLKTCFHVLF